MNKERCLILSQTTLQKNKFTYQFLSFEIEITNNESLKFILLFSYPLNQKTNEHVSRLSKYEELYPIIK